MNPVNAVDTKVKDNLLADAALRNLPADLVVVRGDNLQATLKSRFLRVEPEQVLMEMPRHNDRPAILQPGQFIEVYFKFDHERLGFDSRVVGYSQAPLDEDNTVGAVGVVPPLFLEHRQRRKSYRVSVATLPDLSADLWPELAPHEQFEPIRARLCNLSAGGAAVLIDRHRWRFASDQRYRMRFSLPGQQADYEFMSVVCHVRHVFHSRRQIVGLAFLPGDNQISHREALDRIAQFVAAQQREELFQARRSGALAAGLTAAQPPANAEP